jgi:hypothetical protein
MEAVNIIDRFVGADWLLEFVVLGIPDGVTLEEATFVFKDHKEVTDSGAIITSTITTTATASGQLTQTAPSAGSERAAWASLLLQGADHRQQRFPRGGC